MKKTKPVTYKTAGPAEPSVLRDATVADWGRVVSVRDAKAHLSALLEWVSAGNELTITSDGQPKARLVGVHTVRPRKVFRGMGAFLSGQPVHRGMSAEDAVNADRDARGW